ncbi:MAG TPA: tetrahydrofolate dehydrogenase/cyclohydrolase catalytic domain-containing protein [Treponemataceae bacterium]|nr:bifunctional 5,10-methylene-tetrahydrofolate dehydrogenase/5,10-methylene-tetrahydrofolate cyclohydrolase [Treponema sp.]OQB03553.1 MAG: Bifunctional protein FolD protein [Spirochaetes bacterium ADurb.Bin215]HOS36166.1 tetrahydrofolate dehydrogenase/cyclohydrolase catalytic domain-containing protein [Treponemataceae bacterium]HOU39164.1 tetrahydrofolate dehydrogenase/cyclohydrolase catalytic domain-containing protein [Treponemataceae bacterium]HPL92154.1 tetrahydrofolate dehydrogenase/cycloh
MSATIIDGYSIAASVRSRVAEGVSRLTGKGVHPCLAVVLVGDNPASVSYVSGKERALREVGMKDRTIRLPADTGEKELLELVDSLNHDPDVHGILVQLPLPKHINEQAVIMAIDPSKDVDGFHPVNLGNMLIERECFLPCTPHGVLVLLRETGITTAGAHAVIVGRSNIVGKPLSVLLARRDCNATVTVCHTKTRDLAAITRQADILIAAVGSPRMISADMIKPGAAVIDVGVNRVADDTAKNGYRLVGDVDFAPACEVASAITPVPRGVGPMTIAMLMENTLEAALRTLR